MRTSTPLWFDAPRPASRPPLEGSATYDVVVVGGGLAGLVTALLLARAGRAVGVLEARRIGDGTSGHTTGKVSLLQGTKLSRALRTNRPEVVRGYVEGSREGQAWLRHFCGEHGVPVDGRHATTYATTTAGERRVRDELEAARATGLAVEWTETTELPFTVRGAVRLEDQFQVDPLRLLDALVDAVEAEGGSVHERTRVTGVRHADDGVEVVTAHGAASARHVVVATNQPILLRGMFFGRMRTNRSYALALAPATGGPLWMPTGMHLSADTAVRSLRSARGSDGVDHLLVGGAGHATGRSRPGERLDELATWARGTFTSGRVAHAWSAQDQSPIGGLPFAGPAMPGDHRVQVITGFDKWGLSTAPAAALLLAADLLDGEQPTWGQAFRTWSPHELVAAPSLVAHNAAVVGSLVCERVEHAVRPGGRPICTHLGGVLSWNDAEQSWDCPLHGSRFAKDGSVLEGPATRAART